MTGPCKSTTLSNQPHANTLDGRRSFTVRLRPENTSHFVPYNTHAQHDRLLRFTRNGESLSTIAAQTMTTQRCPCKLNCPPPPAWLISQGPSD